MADKLTELVFILDRSGSMAGLKRTPSAGTTAVLTEQQAAPGEVLVTTVLFDHECGTASPAGRPQNSQAPHRTEEQFGAAPPPCWTPWARPFAAIKAAHRVREAIPLPGCCLPSSPTAWKIPAGNTPIRK